MKNPHMDYQTFLAEFGKMGDAIPVPNLGYRSRNGIPCFCIVLVKDGKLYIKNKFGRNDAFLIDADFYNKALERFINAPAKDRFKVSYYARPTPSNPDYGWGAGNPNVIYAPHLPALFRELWLRRHISVCADESVWESMPEPKGKLCHGGGMQAQEYMPHVERAFDYLLIHFEQIKQSQWLLTLISQANVSIVLKGDKIIISKGEASVSIDRSQFDKIALLVFGERFQSGMAEFLRRLWKRVLKVGGDALISEIIKIILSYCIGHIF